MTARERIFVALDTPDAEQARGLARSLAGSVGGFKVGLELFASAGPDIIRSLRDLGRPVFADIKLHDIPNTVAGAAAALGRLGVSMFTLHALGGGAMLRAGVEAAADAAAQAGFAAPTALAVTILTSHHDATLGEVGIEGPSAKAALRLAEVAQAAGVGGAVCSALEVRALRRAFASGRLVVPGIRPAGAAQDDQARVATPAGAVAEGADLLVVGRAITRAADPLSAARAIVAELEDG